jgi:uncharacterized protein with GYD domain
MPMYAMLAKFTQQRMENIKDLPKNLEKARQLSKSFGVEMKTILYTMGQYDVVVIAEAPNDEAIAKNLLAYGQLGVLRTETLKAFTADEFVQLISELP